MAPTESPFIIANNVNNDKCAVSKKPRAVQNKHVPASAKATINGKAPIMTRITIGIAIENVRVIMLYSRVLAKYFVIENQVNMQPKPIKCSVCK